MYRVTYNANLTRLTTFGIPAGCGCLVEYENIDDLRALAADHPGLLAGEVFNLGGGSNVLFLREDYPGTVLRCVGEEIAEITPEGASEAEYAAYPRFRVQAGVVLDRLVDYAASRGLWGLENLAAIPGRVGGAAVQNVGAYGAEFSQCVTRVKAFDLDASRPVEYSVAECDYGYRHSFFKTAAAPRLAICEVEIRLSAIRAPRLGYAGVREALGGVPDETVTPSMIVRAIRLVRAAKLPDPAETGSAGSYFKNPVVQASRLPKVEAAWRAFCEARGRESLPLPYHPSTDGAIKLSAAWMIDKAGCKEFSVGDAALWPTQPLVIVNRGAATAADILALQRMVQDRVEEAFAVRLQPEVVRLGEAQQ